MLYRSAADLLVQGRRYEEAVQAYETQLERSRLRSRSLLGLGQARARLGRDAESRFVLEKLNHIWRNADSPVRSQLP